jgi:predicted MPP superfamily phosphohydrolase
MFLIFITIVSAIYFGLHFFVYKSLTRSLELSQTWVKVLKWFFWVSGLSFFFNVLLSRVFRIYILEFYANTWLGIIAIAFFIFLVQRLATLVFPGQKKALGIAALAITGIITIISLINGLQPPGVKRMNIPIKNLPRELNGFSIVQLSDLHLQHNSKSRLTYIVDKVNSLKPDLIVITGDLIDANICDDPSFCHNLKRLEATHGVLAVTGNHEYFAGPGVFQELAERSHITVLKNQAVTIAGSLQVIGLNDTEARRLGDNGGPNLEAAMKTCHPDKPTVLLFHRPLGFDKAVEKGVDLQLSGHTHAGQIPPMDIIVWFYYKYPAGLYKKDDSYIYTSSGTGWWGPPMRFLSKNEIACFDLNAFGDQEPF